MELDTTAGHPDMDYEEHVRTYKGFIRGTIITSAVVAIILVLMALFLL